MNTAIVNVYHFYRDLLLNFGRFIDFVCGNIFRKIELNIQTRTFLYKDFTDKLYLPALNIQCSSFTNRLEHNNPIFTLQSYGPDSVKSVPLLLNETKQQYIIAALQYNQLTLDLTINASSQLEILEITQYLNQTFAPNLTFQWSFTTFIPIPDFLLENWDLTTDDIYYLYEQKLTSKQNEKIINQEVYYALYQVEPIITVSSVSSYPMDYNNTQSANMSFMLNAYVPIIMYRNDIPSKIAKVVYNWNVHNEPISTVSQDLINNVEEKTDFRFIRGAILSSENITFNTDTDQYTISFTFNIDTYDPSKYLFLIYFPDNSYIYTINDIIQFNSYDSDTSTVIFTIDKNKLSDYQNRVLNDVINNEYSIEGVIFEKA